MQDPASFPIYLNLAVKNGFSVLFVREKCPKSARKTFFAPNLTKSVIGDIMPSAWEKEQLPGLTEGLVRGLLKFHAGSYTRLLIREVIMSERKIRLNGARDAELFVQAAERCSYDVDVCYNRVVIDAKSLMGVLSMDLRKVLTVRYHHDADREFDKVLEK